MSFTIHHLPQAPTIAAYCKVSNRSEESVYTYLRHRRHHQVVQKKIVKFVEAFWRCVFYTYFTYLGYQALFTPTTAGYVQNSIHYWADWPYHPINNKALFYYTVELGCYIHQLLYTEVSRSDSLEMYSHHIITILLITMSFLCNYWRVGSSILLLHDISDIFLEFAKVCNYISKAEKHAYFKHIVDPVFGIFAFTFFVTRLVLYPR
ncbi:hypothetical protein EON65_15235 [archaeon]|nr:MAG: hypothetical protein EON65_15235 [archaeon]